MADAGLSLGSNAAMSHLGPFFLILLCFQQKQYDIKRLGLSILGCIISAFFLDFSSPRSKPESWLKQSINHHRTRAPAA
jgi:hypothetical protein